MRRIATFIGQFVALAAIAAIIVFLSVSAIRGVQDLWQRFTTQRDQGSRVAMYPGTATAIFGLNSQINETKTQIAALTPVVATDVATDESTDVALLATPVLPPTFTPVLPPSVTAILEIATAQAVAPQITEQATPQATDTEAPIETQPATSTLTPTEPPTATEMPSPTATETIAPSETVVPTVLSTEPPTETKVATEVATTVATATEVATEVAATAEVALAVSDTPTIPPTNALPAVSVATAGTESATIRPVQPTAGPNVVTQPTGDGIIGCDNPLARITNLKADYLYQSTLSFTGAATLPAFGWSKLEYRAEGEKSWHSIIVNTKPITQQGTLGTFNTTQVAPGYYWFQLTVFDNAGNIPIRPCAIRIKIGAQST